MTTKNLAHKFIAILLVFTLAYVQTVLINHLTHHNTQHSHDSSNKATSSLLAKCMVCDYVLNKRQEPALLSSQLTLVLPVSTVISLFSEETTQLPFSFQEEQANKGPPFI